jgi:hypothetical protein
MEAERGKRTYACEKVTSRPQKHSCKQQRYPDSMSEFAVWLLLALTPQADHTRRRPYGALQEIILVHVPACAGHVANARAQWCRCQRLLCFIAGHVERVQRCQKSSIYGWVDRLVREGVGRLQGMLSRSPVVSMHGTENRPWKRTDEKEGRRERLQQHGGVVHAVVRYDGKECGLSCESFTLASAQDSSRRRLISSAARIPVRRRSPQPQAPHVVITRIPTYAPGHSHGDATWWL